MKRAMSGRGLALFVGFVLLFAGSVGAVSAQTQPRLQGKEAVRGWLKELKITDEEISKLSAIVAKDEPALSKARADIRMHQAEIARLLLAKEARNAENAGKLRESFSKKGLTPKEAERWAETLLLLRSCLERVFP